MKKFLFIVFLLSQFLLFQSCHFNKNKNTEESVLPPQGQQSQQQQTENKINQQAIHFDAPVSLDSTQYLMFPLRMQPHEKQSRLSILSKGDKDSYYAHCWNIAFYNKETGEQYLLDNNKKMVINSYHIKSNDSTSLDFHLPENIIIYSITSQDFNLDKKLNTEDPENLFISDKTGKNFRQITPSNQYVTSWQVIDGSSKIIIRTLKDINNDKVFDSQDDIIPLIFDFKTDTSAKPVFNVGFMKQTKQLFDKYWSRKE